MPTFLLHHKHRPLECAIAIAAWKGFDSPLRGGRPLGTCHAGGHQLWWIVEAPDNIAALAQLPPFVAARTALDQVSEVQIP
jgi:hypothetical protein